MSLNPFFLQGSPNEQFLVQDLINEQLKMYGVDVYYLPRKIFKTDDITYIGNRRNNRITVAFGIAS